MKKTIFIISTIFLFFTSLSCGKRIHVNYDVSYGIIGKIGTAEATLNKKAKQYTISVKLAATGLAKLLSGGRKEQHISKGHIKNGLMISDLYQVIKSHGDIVINKKI